MRGSNNYCCYKYLIFFILFFSNNIFSQGSVAFFTGTSSSGKTTTLNIFKNFLDKQGMRHYECLSCDDFVSDAFYEKAKERLNCDGDFEEVLKKLYEDVSKDIINKLEGEAEFSGFKKFIKKILEFIKSGKNVLCECILPDNKKLLKYFFSSLKNVRIFLVLVYCSFGDLIGFVENRNEKAKNASTVDERCDWRDLSDVVGQFCGYYRPWDGKKDRESDLLGYLSDEEIISIFDEINNNLDRKKILKHFFLLEEESDKRRNIELTPKLNYNFIITNIWDNPIIENQIKDMFKLFLTSSKEVFLSNEKFFTQ